MRQRQPLTIEADILSRIVPLVAQRKKDCAYVYTHTNDKLYRPTIRAICEEAIEFYADIHLPIDTTPNELVVSTGIPNKVEKLPHSGWYTIKTTLREYFPKLTRTHMEYKRKLEMHLKIMHGRGLAKNQEGPLG